MKYVVLRFISTKEELETEAEHCGVRDIIDAGHGWWIPVEREDGEVKVIDVLPMYNLLRMSTVNHLLAVVGDRAYDSEVAGYFHRDGVLAFALEKDWIEATT